MSSTTIFAARRVVPPDFVAPAPRSSTSRKLMSPDDVPPPDSFSMRLRHASAYPGDFRPLARVVLEDARLVFHELEDRHQVVAPRLDEACGDLRPRVRVRGHLYVVRGQVHGEAAARAADAVLVVEPA